MIKQISLSQITGFRVGHARDTEHATGCTAIICENGGWAGVDVREGAPPQGKPSSSARKIPSSRFTVSCSPAAAPMAWRLVTELCSF